MVSEESVSKAQYALAIVWIVGDVSTIVLILSIALYKVIR